MIKSAAKHNPKIAVCGLWHLGSVTAACMADLGFDVIGFDNDTKTIDELRSGHAPLFEPGLDSLLQKGIASGKIYFSADAEAISAAELIWITFETPVNSEDEAEYEEVVEAVVAAVKFAKKNAIVLISSQLPLGATDTISKATGRDDIAFAYSPENLRLGEAIGVFRDPGRIVVGVQDTATRERLQPILATICARLIWMSIRSAELSKHAINSFLALSVAFSNELARIAEMKGANAFDVEAALKSEERIGPKAYLRPGEAFSGGTLARDLVFLSNIADDIGFDAQLFRAAIKSNTRHRSWPFDALKIGLKAVGKTGSARVCVLGLAYKVGTDTLRRSNSLALAKQCLDAGFVVVAHDPVVKSLGAHANDRISLQTNIASAIRHSDAVIVMTPYEEYKSLKLTEFEEWAEIGTGPRRIIIDQQRVLRHFSGHPNVQYYTLGVPVDEA
jgi:UDPglucose 6-dehydrogenase